MAFTKPAFDLRLRPPEYKPFQFPMLGNELQGPNPLQAALNLMRGEPTASENPYWDQLLQHYQSASVPELPAELPDDPEMEGLMGRYQESLKPVAPKPNWAQGILALVAALSTGKPLESLGAVAEGIEGNRRLQEAQQREAGAWIPKELARRTQGRIGEERSRIAAWTKQVAAQQAQDKLIGLGLYGKAKSQDQINEELARQKAAKELEDLKQQIRDKDALPKALDEVATYISGNEVSPDATRLKIAKLNTLRHVDPAAVDGAIDALNQHISTWGTPAWKSFLSPKQKAQSLADRLSEARYGYTLAQKAYVEKMGGKIDWEKVFKTRQQEFDEQMRTNESLRRDADVASKIDYRTFLKYAKDRDMKRAEDALSLGLLKNRAGTIDRMLQSLIELDREIAATTAELASTVTSQSGDVAYKYDNPARADEKTNLQDKVTRNKQMRDFLSKKLREEGVALNRKKPLPTIPMQSGSYTLPSPFVPFGKPELNRKQKR